MAVWLQETGQSLLGLGRATQPTGAERTQINLGSLTHDLVLL